MRIPLLLFLLAAVPALADDRFVFQSIDGGDVDISAHDGPVLVVNTASLCAFTAQYDGLQKLHETYGQRGVMVLAVPSNDFRQELGSDDAVKEFCDVQFGLTLPMTEITHVRGPDAHPFYAWLADTEGWAPRWNFHKVLMDDGQVVATFGSTVRPEAQAITRALEARLR